MKVLGVILIIIVVIVLISVFWPIVTGRSPGGDVSGGSLYQSTDGGENWHNLEKFPGGEVSDLAFDSSQPDFIFAGTENRGLWRGKRDGTSWEQFQESLGEGSKIFDILEPASLPSLKALVFFENRGRMIASSERGREELLSTPLERFTYFKGAFFRGRVRVIGSDGGLYESLDGGRAWSVRARFKDGLLLFAENRSSPSEIWVIDGRGFFYRSQDGGRNWTDLTPGLADFAAYEDARIIFYESRTGILYHGSRHGLLASYDKGESFKEIPMPAPGNTLPVSAVATDWANPSKLFVGSGNQLYISTDAGASWKIVEIPAQGSISSILIDPAETKNIFVGLKKTERVRQSLNVGG